MKNKFEELWNVVIMPMKGKYPLTSQISGSDLDGDNFFISWDSRLIPK
jgi:RNA-dependent RNA polymerase